MHTPLADKVLSGIRFLWWNFARVNYRRIKGTWLPTLTVCCLVIHSPNSTFAQATTNLSNQQDLGNLLKCREIIVIRHGEKDPNSADPKNPTLSEDGRIRSTNLLHVLRDAGVTRIFASDKTRARQTAAPLRQHLGDKCKYREDLLKHDGMNATNIVDCVKTNVVANDVVLIVSHSHQIPTLLNILGDPVTEKIEGQPDYYDKMFVFYPSVTGQELRMVRLRYGKDSEAK